MSHYIFCRGWIKCFNCLRILYINVICFNQIHLLSPTFHFLPHPPPPYHSPQHHVLFFKISKSILCCEYVHEYRAIHWNLGTLSEARIWKTKKWTKKNPQTLTVPSNSHQLPIIAFQLGVGLCDTFLIHAAVSLYVQWPRHVLRTSLWSSHLQLLPLTIFLSPSCDDPWALGQWVWYSCAL